MVRPTLRCGSTISAPLLVMVVKPLKARIDRATEATNPSGAAGSEADDHAGLDGFDGEFGQLIRDALL